MEAPEVVTGSHSTGSGDCPGSPATVTAKRKRTERQRAAETALSPPNNIPASSVDLSSATEEEEDMAHCLILLAQGRAFDRSPPAVGGGGNTEKFVSRKFTETVTTAGGKVGFYVYECKTCNKCFPSFQALGGHRASHKKPKLSVRFPPTDDPKQVARERSVNTDASSAAGSTSPGSNKLRVHECSMCGAEFWSGQALGGHMRRHRPVVAGRPELQEAVEGERNGDLLPLDLNLPAPADEPTVAFLPAVPFSATSALVDCHY